jgi:hypothetical protein
MKKLNLTVLVLAASLSTVSFAKADVIQASAAPIGFGEIGTGVVHAAGVISTFSENGITYTSLSGTSEIRNPPSDGDGAVPFNTNARYISVLGGGELDLTFGQSNKLGLYWGSIDAYNTIEFKLNGVTVANLGGSDLLLQASLNADGNQGSYNSNRFVWLTDTNGAFNEVVLRSSSNSFEFMNVQAVPEATTWAMMILGFLGLGFLGYRKSSKSTGAAFRMV